MLGTQQWDEREVVGEVASLASPASVRRAELRRMITERGWTREIELQAVLIVEAVAQTRLTCDNQERIVSYVREQKRGKQLGSSAAPGAFEGLGPSRCRPSLAGRLAEPTLSSLSCSTLSGT